MATPKEQHEEAVCRRFLDAYNANHGTNYQFIKLEKPQAPDGLCSNDLHLEVVTAYYDEAAAKDQWDLALGKAKGPLPSVLLVEPDHIGSAAIDACITNKATKEYIYTGKLWLVIDVRAPLQEWTDIENGYLDELRNVPAGPFDEIWVLLYDIDGDHVGKVAIA